MKKLSVLSIIITALVLVFSVGMAQGAAPTEQQNIGSFDESPWGSFGGSFAPIAPATVACSNPCYRAEFAKDVTIPDGSYIAPGQWFTKTWRVRNIGACTWKADTKLVFHSGHAMSGPQTVSLPHQVTPGSYVNISVKLQAPLTGGVYQGNWLFRAPDGSLFGVGCNGIIPIWANITTWKNNCYCVGSYSCNCYQPCYGTVCSTYAPAYSQPAKPEKNPYCNNKIRSINDITVKDGEEMLRNTYFRKTWKMKNAGTCVWNEGYSLIFTGGDGMSGAQSIPMPKTVYPGETVEISIDLRAPSTLGKFRGYYMLQDNMGYRFGFGPYANKAFWVEVKVAEPVIPAIPTAKPTLMQPAKPTPINTTIAPTKPASTAIQPIAPVATPAPSNAPIENDMPTEMDDSKPDANNEFGIEELNQKGLGSTHNACGAQRIEIEYLSAGEYSIHWFVSNDGNNTWNSEKYRVVNTGIGEELDLMGFDTAVPPTAPGEEAQINIAAKLKNPAMKKDSWMKFNLSDGTESFCEVYFPIIAD